MRNLFGCIALVLSLPLCAAAPSSDISDLWWNPAESGWGANIILQNDIAFMTFFVYDANQNPVWYTSDIHYQGSSTWTGTLYATKGPWFGDTFTPSTVLIRTAGTARFVLSAFNQATLTYTVDGAPVTKALQRQTWTNDNYSGTYAGGYSVTQTGCNPSSLNGLQETAGYLTVSHAGASISLSATTTVGSCSFAGGFAQVGRHGSIAAGAYTCTDGTHGTFTASEMSLSQSGFTAKVAGQNQFCQWSGYLGGIARAQ